MMNLKEYEKSLFNDEDLERVVKAAEREVEERIKEIKRFKEQGEKRIQQVREWEDANNFIILGSIHKDGREKELLFIKRYPDYSQRDYRYRSNKISEVKKVLDKLKEKYSKVDWSNFREEC